MTAKEIFEHYFRMKNDLADLESTIKMLDNYKGDWKIIAAKNRTASVITLLNQYKSLDREFKKFGETEFVEKSIPEDDV